MQVMGAVADVRSGEIVESETAMQDRMQGWRPQKETEGKKTVGCSGELNPRGQQKENESSWVTPARGLQRHM